MIELRHLKKQYEQACPLKDVSTVIHEGDVISIIGPSGTGKSTLLRCLNLLEAPTSGQILFNGEDITDPKCDIDKVRRQIGMVFQSYNLYEHLTVVENVMLAQTNLLNRSREEAFRKSIALLKSVGMDSRAFQYPKQLSGGQKQRVAIARTLGMDPEIILFDEPTSALDPLMVDEVEKVMEQLAKEGRTMMIVTHSMSLAQRISNRVFYMDQGGIYEDGTPEQIFKHPQKPRTQDFLFNQYHLKTKISSGPFDLEAFNDQIAAFVKKHGLSARTQYRMQLAFEEICISRMHAAQKENQFIDVDYFYDEKADEVCFGMRHNVVEFIGEFEKDPITLALISEIGTDYEINDLTESPDGALREAKMRIVK